MERLRRLRLVPDPPNAFQRERRRLHRKESFVTMLFIAALCGIDSLVLGLVTNCLVGVKVGGGHIVMMVLFVGPTVALTNLMFTHIYVREHRAMRARHRAHMANHPSRRSDDAPPIVANGG